MASNQTFLSVVLVVVLILVGFYMLDPTLGGLLRHSEGFFAGLGGSSLGTAMPGQMSNSGSSLLDSVTSNQYNANKKACTGPDCSENFVGNMDNEEEVEEEFRNKKEGFADLAGYEGPAQFGSSDAPAGCYPRDQLTPSELLPKDQNSTWAQQNPMGNGSLKGKNFLSAGALIGVNTVGQSLRNANWDLRSEPPNPQVSVSVFNNSTIEPDTNRRPLEIA